MAVTANSIVTPQTPIAGKAKVTAANTNYDAPTAVQQLLPAQTNGARITRVQAIAAATTVASDAQLYGYDGVSYRLIKAVQVGVVTIAAGNTAAINPIDFGFSDANPLILGPNEQLMCGASVAQTSLHFRAEGAAY
jgi:hypothetical protein